MPPEIRKLAIVGAGHNGLVCACYLADAGFDVTVFERRSLVGGLCVTEELFPGCKVSSVAAYYGMLRRQIIDDLKLEELGLSTYLTNPVEIVLLPNGGFLFTPRYEGSARVEIGAATTEDLDGWSRFWGDVGKAAAVFRSLYLKSGLTQTDFETAMIEAGLPLFAKSLFHGTFENVLKSYVSHPQLLAAAATTVAGFPNQKGTLYSCLHLGTAETQGEVGAWGFARGGMGAVTQALQKAAIARGVTILTDAPVQSLEVEGRRVVGIVTVDGVQGFDAVISNADPVTTFAKLLPGEHLLTSVWNPKSPSIEAGETSHETKIVAGKEFKVQDSSIGNKLNSMNMAVSGGKAHFLLRGLPEFPAVRELNHKHACAFVITPSYAETLAAGEKISQGLMPDTLMLTLSFPSVNDEDVAPEGKHLANLDIHWLPSLCDGQSWDDSNRHRILDLVLDCLDKHSPDFRELVEQQLVISPGDLKSTYGLNSMVCWHVPMGEGFLVEQRSYGGAGAYSTHLENLYLCGAGTFPGGNVTGAPGYNCAQEIIANYVAPLERRQAALN